MHAVPAVFELEINRKILSRENNRLCGEILH